ncbi:hypothetical protein G647_05682 [Cladophialophora carrionii CBS 160.54]|uniref:Transcription factor domain-containing protein n=1 Tax=Cladophialophora carrionii CBS 160.54 TaxID=1279043 RepID=V9DAM2_9EURO|nr:uncharacterized protein G647_05682 [Cladophialophora carrionii CBS 160.54]ETI23875.1 hypothetical protein G647_05682 [Cladophialophora carrionii CBS 160.54]
MSSRKIENLEREVSALKQRLEAQQNGLQTSVHVQDATAITQSQSAAAAPDRPASMTQTSPETQSSPGTLRRKRTRSQFEVEIVSVPNFVAKGLITYEQAQLFFGAFFQGCDRYVPIFDPVHDTFESISARSALLFNAIITIGCGVLSDADSQIGHLLNFHLKKMLNLVIVSPDLTSLETVQALLVTACYVSERSLLLAFATRMALELQLPDAYEDLRRKLVSRGSSSSSSEKTDPPEYDESDAMLMRRARGWFQLMVLEQILHVDAGNLRSFQLKGDARRCRILLNRPFTNSLDLRLLSQVELNALRGKVHDSISGMEHFDEEEVMDILHDVQVDIDVWFNDWKNIMEAAGSTTETPVLLVNLEVQKCWSQTVALCRAIRALGKDNLAGMSPVQQDLLLMAKDSLRRHLRIILDQPQHYLSKFCYATDFVWAKCAFCFLLLLKLTRLLPEADDHAKRRLLEDGNKLLKELNKAGGGWTSGGRTTTSRMYLQVLHQSIQKYGRALESDSSAPGQNESSNHANSVGQDSQSPLNYFWTAGGNAAANEIDSFIPEQFVTEWDFPGLEFSASGPVSGDGFFDEFLMANLFSDTMFPGC